MDEEILNRLKHLHEWAAPSHGLQVETIDAHTGGQALRLVTGGLPPLKGGTLMECWDYARTHFDHLRRSLVCEPRGHMEMYGCILTKPQRTDSHFGALFFHRGGFSPMCGHGIIALTTILLETGIVDMRGPETRLKIDTPAGLVRAYGKIANDRVEKVYFESVPSWVVGVREEVEVPGIGRVRYDVAYGGAFFAFVNAVDVGLTCSPGDANELSAAGDAIRQAIQAQRTFDHPFDPALAFLFGVVFLDRPVRRRKGSADSRQVCVFMDGCVDRSPAGMALCARLALLDSRGELRAGEPYVVEGLLGSHFSGHVVAREAGDVRTSLICEVEGRAWITGRHTFFISPDDPLRDGFLL